MRYHLQASQARELRKDQQRVVAVKNDCIKLEGPEREPSQHRQNCIKLEGRDCNRKGGL
jgi:hypothetical protein